MGEPGEEGGGGKEAEQKALNSLRSRGHPRYLVPSARWEAPCPGPDSPTGALTAAPGGCYLLAQGWDFSALYKCPVISGLPILGRDVTELEAIWPPSFLKTESLGPALTASFVQ